jgi:hypothetical protein
MAVASQGRTSWALKILALSCAQYGRGSSAPFPITRFRLIAQLCFEPLAPKRHEDWPKREVPCPRLFCQRPQISAGRFDGGRMAASGSPRTAMASRQASGLIPSIGRSRRTLARNSGQHRIDPDDGDVMSGRRPLIKGYFLWRDNRGCGHVFGLLMRMLWSAGPDVVRWSVAPSRYRAVCSDIASGFWINPRWLASHLCHPRFWRAAFGCGNL